MGEVGLDIPLLTSLPMLPIMFAWTGKPWSGPLDGGPGVGRGVSTSAFWGHHVFGPPGAVRKSVGEMGLCIGSSRHMADVDGARLGREVMPPLKGSCVG